MTPDRPLHVRVAMALGQEVILLGAEWRVVRRDRLVDTATYREWTFPLVEHEGSVKAEALTVPRYDTDWSAGGPLIERFKIGIEPPDAACDKPERHDCLKWKAHPQDRNVSLRGIEPATHPTVPLEAVCNLILALHEAGKLPKVSA